MTPLIVRNAPVTLAQAVKIAGLVETGGQAKQMIRDGAVRVNGAVVTQPGKKLVLGDRFQSADGQEWIITE